MEQTRKELHQSPKYDRFLHSSVGDDGRGASISVLSMLARLGVDPWEEASELAALPEDSARQRLDALMARFTDAPSLSGARSKVVARLVGVLPREVAEPAGWRSRAAIASSRRLDLWLVTIGTIFVLITILAGGE